MTPSKQAKARGLKSLAEVSQMTGQALSTLDRWASEKPELFRIVLTGCATEKHLKSLVNLLAREGG